MTFVNSGKNRIVALMSADVSYAMLGGSNTAVAVTDTTLASAMTASSGTVSKTVTDKQLVVDYSLNSATIVGSTVAEFGVFNSSDVMFSRVVFGSLTHASTDEWQISTRYWIN